MRPMTPFDGFAWVTGASTGLGRATALQLVRDGWRVVATARSAEKLESLATEAESLHGKIIAMPGDITDANAMAAIISEIEADHGDIALAVLNAGIYQPQHGNQLDVDAFKQTIDVNLMGTVNCMVPVVEHMTARKQGQVAFVASVTAYGGLPTSAAYGATKAALNNMAESLKFDFDKMGIHTQVVNPGFVDTPATADNDFTMPALMDVDKAAERLVAGLKTMRFEITFPRRFTYVLKLINLLPRWLYFPIMTKMMGWDKRGLERS